MSLRELISIDSYGWIERFTNGSKALRYNQIIESCQPKEIITSVVVLYEVYKKIKKLRGEDQALLAVAVLSQTTIVPIDQTLSLEAADYSLEFGLHFSDALVYATARHWKAELYTSDGDLRVLKAVSFV
jgi:toxin FitB